MDRDVRQAGSERSGVVGSADGLGAGDDRRRDSSMSDLLDIVREVAQRAEGDEQIEAYAVRTSETDIEVFGGDVESLTTAGIEGIGIRVIVDHRQGLAWAGSLEPEVVAETLREARDNAAFGQPDEWYGVATPA